MKILDTGCGPADILAYLPGVEYWGFDISEAYINKAKARFQDRGTFYCKQLDWHDLDKIPKVDVVLATGLLHHLDDNDSLEVMRLAFQTLHPGGRLLTVDPCLDDAQNRIARFLVRRDRGQNVRNKVAYEQLASSIFPSVSIEVRHQPWIPYTHCFMECGK
jgi:SAM-dependent methyltransferase